MPRLGGFGVQLASFFWRASVDDEVNAELAFHVEMRTRELVARGMEPAAARAAAVAKFGDIGAVGAECRAIGHQREREMDRAEYVAELREDVRFAIRQLRKSPGFTVVAVLTLALGIGATTAIFSAVDAVVLRPFAMAHPDRTVLITERWKEQDGNVSAGNFVDLAARTHGFDQLAAMNFQSMTITNGDAPNRVIATQATWTLFPALGIKPMLGRTFDAADDAPGHDDVVVLSFGLWTRAFGGDRSVVGRSIQLDRRAYHVIGVMPAEFNPVLANEDLWVPIAFTPERRAQHDEHYLVVIGVLRPGVTRAQGTAELSAVAASLARDFPRENAGRGLRMRPLGDVLVGGARTSLLVVLGAVLCVLLIACGNVANLLLARGEARTKELAIRAAIGAGRGRIARQLLTESLVLAFVATGVGLALAWAGIHVLIGAAPQGIPRIEQTRIDGPVLLFALGMAVLSSVVFGLAPALRATRGDLTGALKEGGRALMAGARDRMRTALIVAEVAIALTLLVGAGLLIRSAVYLQHVNAGFDPRGLLAARISLPATVYDDPAVVTQTFERIAAEVSARPGVIAAAVTSGAPLSGSGGSNGLIPEGRPLTLASVIDSRLHIITPGYFATMRVPLVRGRAFTPQDTRNAPRVMLVSAALAKAAWPGQDPIGKRVACCESNADGTPIWKTVVGVTGDVRGQGPTQDLVPEFYLPLEQTPPAAWGWINRTMTVVVRASAPDAASLTSTIRAVVHDVDPGLPVFSVATMDALLSQSVASERFNTTLLAALGVVGLLLAAAGIYSVIAYFVALRTHEIGVRMALGASSSDVVRLMTRQGMRPVAAGVLIGGFAAEWASRLLSGSLYGVRAGDPATLGAVAAVLVLVSLMATLVPARRATKVDPLTAFHA